MGRMWVSMGLHGARKEMATPNGKRDDTTLGVKRTTKRRLLKLKLHPRETEDDLILRATEALEVKIRPLPSEAAA